MLARILAVAILCNHEKLRFLVVSTWIARLEMDSISHVVSIHTADKYGIRELQGRAYYTFLIHMVPPHRISSRTGLETTQQIRLLQGHMSLVALWDRLRADAPTFKRCAECIYHDQGCLIPWKEKWLEIGRSESTLKCSSVDVLGRLQSMWAGLGTDECLRSDMTPQCRNEALLAVSNLIYNHQKDLLDHFAELE